MLLLIAISAFNCLLFSVKLLSICSCVVHRRFCSRRRSFWSSNCNDSVVEDVKDLSSRTMRNGPCRRGDVAGTWFAREGCSLLQLCGKKLHSGSRSSENSMPFRLRGWRQPETRLTKDDVLPSNQFRRFRCARNC